MIWLKKLNIQEVKNKLKYYYYNFLVIPEKDYLWIKKKNITIFIIKIILILIIGLLINLFSNKK